MKRALAERAKQSGLPNGVGPSVPGGMVAEPSLSSNGATPHTAAPFSESGPGDSTSTSPPELTPTMKPEINVPLSSVTPVRSPPATSPRPKKRLRESSSKVKLEEQDEDDSNASAFYLRHQNRALASELRSLKYQLSRLEHERDYRRRQCSLAIQNLNSLQAIWKQMETALQSGEPPPPAATAGAQHTASSASSHAPLSTGSGNSVELIGDLLKALEAIGTASSGDRICQEGEDDSSTSTLPIDAIDNGMDVDGEDGPKMNEEVDPILRVSENISRRATALHQWIWALLNKMGDAEMSTSPNSLHSEAAAKAEQQVAKLKAKNKTLKATLEEVSRSRDELASSDKRVRRGLYRLAAGRVELKEVLKAIVTSDEDKEAAAAWLEPVPSPATPSSTVAVAAVKTEGTAADIESASVDSNMIVQLKKQLADLEQVARTRDEQIQKLISEKEEQMKKISGLLLKEDDKKSDFQTEEEVKRSDLYTQMTATLADRERKVREMEEREARLKDEWAKAVANAEASKAAMMEMQTKHMKRWVELAEGDTNGETQGAKAEKKSDSNRIVTLQHKLTQALENVRQAESTRINLQEAIVLNDALQAKFDEYKTNYSALRQERPSDPATESQTAKAPATDLLTTDLLTPSSQTTSKGDKSDRAADKAYRKLKKEYEKLVLSRQNAKDKLERAAKEMDSLSQTNSRLLRQAAEKDEMNAKSLSTILHLKQLSDQITKEKENLEQQVKSAQQLALAARLASNARERLSEEVEKERQDLQASLKEWEIKYETLSKLNIEVESKLSQQQALMSGYVNDANKAKERCEELAAESSRLEQEKQQMAESLAIARNDAAEAAKLSEGLSTQPSGDGSGGLSGFTAEQLSTQVSVLKSRLACPVCNHRDKKCILLRCRHMFCKPCVDENIKNRSRKCPACGGRFDTKDVADVWL